VSNSPRKLGGVLAIALRRQAAGAQNTIIAAASTAASLAAFGRTSICMLSPPAACSEFERHCRMVTNEMLGRLGDPEYEADTPLWERHRFHQLEETVRRHTDRQTRLEKEAIDAPPLTPSRIGCRTLGAGAVGLLAARLRNFSRMEGSASENAMTRSYFVLSRTSRKRA
jgi:hypothetical protein